MTSNINENKRLSEGIDEDQTAEKVQSDLGSIMAAWQYNHIIDYSRDLSVSPEVTKLSNYHTIPRFNSFPNDKILDPLKLKDSV